VTATNNGSDGVRVYSTYAYACFGLQGISVLVNGGTFQNNGGYGLFVAPGPLGSMTFGLAPLFGGNILGDSLLTLDVNCSACNGSHSTPDDNGRPKKPVKEVKLPATGGDPVAQDCENYSGTLLDLPGGTSVQVDCPFTGDSLAQEIGVDGLPATLPPGPDFVAAVSVGMTTDGQPVSSLGADSSVTISFDIPEGMDGKKFYILYWDPAAKDGQGDWIELPLQQFPASEFPLNPPIPDDNRTVLSGVQVVDGQVTATVNFPGTFALVAR